MNIIFSCFFSHIFILLWNGCIIIVRNLYRCMFWLYVLELFCYTCKNYSFSCFYFLLHENTEVATSKMSSARFYILRPTLFLLHTQVSALFIWYILYSVFVCLFDNVNVIFLYLKIDWQVYIHFNNRFGALTVLNPTETILCSNPYIVVYQLCFLTFPVDKIKYEWIVVNTRQHACCLILVSQRTNTHFSSSRM